MMKATKLDYAIEFILTATGVYLAVGGKGVEAFLLFILVQLKTITIYLRTISAEQKKALEVE